MKYSKEQFYSLLKEKYNEPFEIIEYNGTSKEGKYYCGYCKQEYHLLKMGKLLSENRKHICAHCFSSKYAEQVLDYFNLDKTLSFIQFGYKQNLHKPTAIYSCNSCGEQTEKPYIEFLKYPTCIHCKENAKRRNTNTINALLPEGFKLMEEYSGQYEKTLVRHECGLIFKIRPKDLINGHSYCPKCSKKASKGERKIMEFLSENKIEYIKEKMFDWSENKRYDFFLPKYNLLIEYNGIQHYKEINNFFLSLEEQQKIDSLKQQLAIERGFDYLIISYLQFDEIEYILAQRLKENT